MITYQMFLFPCLSAIYNISHGHFRQITEAEKHDGGMMARWNLLRFAPILGSHFIQGFESCWVG